MHTGTHAYTYTHACTCTQNIHMLTYTHTCARMHTHTFTLSYHTILYTPDTLESMNAELIATIERLEEERDDEIQRVQELMMEAAQLQMGKEKL